MGVVKVKALKESHKLNGLGKGAKGTSNSDGSEVNKSNNVHGELLRDKTGRISLVIPSGTNITARNGITESVGLIEDKDSVRAIELTGYDLGSQAGSVLIGTRLRAITIKEAVCKVLGCSVVVAGDRGARLSTAPVNMKVERASERSGRGDFSSKH